MPGEKYSPFLLVFRLYFRPLSVLAHSTLAPAIGVPSIFLAVPLTVPVAWANTGDTHSVATATTSITISKRCFIFLASRLTKLISLLPRFETIQTLSIRHVHQNYPQALPASAAYGIGSALPASWNARRRSTQLSHTPHARSSRL